MMKITEEREVAFTQEERRRSPFRGKINEYLACKSRHKGGRL